MKVEVDLHLDLTDKEADMLGDMIEIYGRILYIHNRDGLGLEQKFHQEDLNAFFYLVEKINNITGKEFTYC